MRVKILASSVFFFYVKKRLPCVKKNGFPSVKMRTCTWKNLQKCPWKTNSLREIFSKFTYVKIWRSIREKNEKFLPWKLSTLPWKKKRKEICRILQQRDTFAVLSLQFYNFYLQSNAYVTTSGNIDPAARPEIKISMYKTGGCTYRFISIDFSFRRQKLLTWLDHAKFKGVQLSSIRTNRGKDFKRHIFLWR